MNETLTIKFQWKTAITHPQNSDGWNIETTHGDLNFDRHDAQATIERTNSTLCAGDANEVTVGRIWAIDEQGEEISL